HVRSGIVVDVFARLQQAEDLLDLVVPVALMPGAAQEILSRNCGRWLIAVESHRLRGCINALQPFLLQWMQTETQLNGAGWGAPGVVDALDQRIQYLEQIVQVVETAARNAEGIGGR